MDTALGYWDILVPKVLYSWTSVSVSLSILKYGIILPISKDTIFFFLYYASEWDINKQEVLLEYK